MARIAFFGTGAMGSRMARNLLAAGHELAIWNRDAAKAAELVAAGASAARTPRAAAQGVAIAIAMLRDDEASRSVWLDPEDGALGGLAEGAVAIESSTLTPAWVRELAGRVAAVGARMLDAPVAGSRPQAEARQLIYFIGGEEAALATVRPVLEAMGGALHHVGAVGDGAAVKLALNALFGIQVAAMAEQIGALARAGLDLPRALDAMIATSVCSPAAKAAAASMLASAFAPQFPVSLAEKDLGYALAQAGSHDVAAPMTLAARAVFAAAATAGFGDDNLTAVARLYR